MDNPIQTARQKIGLPPGALVHVGKRKSPQASIHVIDYNETEFRETACEKAEDCFSYRDTDTVSWININGLHDTDLISAIGEHYGLHPLLLEDVLNTGHRPKSEEFETYVFFTLKMLGVSKAGQSLVNEQVSFVLGKNWVISFQEQEGDIFDGLRNRLRESMGNLRKQGADYLLYRFIDTVVDNYFLVTEHVSNQNEKLEEKVLTDPNEKRLREIQVVKKQLIGLKKAISPLREAVSSLDKDNSDLIRPTTTRYLRDVYEHIIQVNDSIEGQRETIANIMELHLSGISQKMNEVMKVLTIIATIFIPLTFIAGIYGMNFQHMPELTWKYGYVGVWILMLAIFVVMLIYFKRKKWM